MLTPLADNGRTAGLTTGIHNAFVAYCWRRRNDER